MRFMLRLVTSIVLLQTLTAPIRAQEPVAMKVAAPGFQGIETWINAQPLTWKELRGKVIVLHFWTFG